MSATEPESNRKPDGDKTLYSQKQADRLDKRLAQALAEARSKLTLKELVYQRAETLEELLQSGLTYEAVAKLFSDQLGTLIRAETLRRHLKTWQAEVKQSQLPSVASSLDPVSVPTAISAPVSVPTMATAPASVPDVLPQPQVKAEQAKPEAQSVVAQPQAQSHIPSQPPSQPQARVRSAQPQAAGTETSPHPPQTPPPVVAGAAPGSRTSKSTAQARPANPAPNPAVAVAAS